MAPDEVLTSNSSGFVCVADNGSNSDSTIVDATPVGLVAFFALSTCPPGWSPANGASGTVAVRGGFVRALDGGAGRDPDGTRALGSWQGDAIRNITGYADFAARSDQHSSFTGGGTGAIRTWKIDLRDTNLGTGDDARVAWMFDASRVVPTAPENRPLNVVLLACQKMP